MSLQDDLYNTMLESPLGALGAEQTLPALSELLRELRSEKFWHGKRLRRRLSEEQMISAWAEYRQALKGLRERICQHQQGWDDLLSWLAMFLIDHYHELALISAAYEPKFQLIFDMGKFGGVEPEDGLAMRDDWQRWAVDWLRDALRDDGLYAKPPSTGGDQGGNDDGESGVSEFLCARRSETFPRRRRRPLYGRG